MQCAAWPISTRLGIVIAGLSIMAPERRVDINSLGGKSIISGTLTTCLMAAIVGH
jgi:CNT family concentrative nucleoside transporter